MYILNLGVYTVTAFLVSSNSSPYQQEQLACIMVGTAFLVFSGTLVYHLYTQLRNIAMLRSLCSRVAAMKWFRLWPMKAPDREGEVQLETLNIFMSYSPYIRYGQYRMRNRYYSRTRMNIYAQLRCASSTRIALEILRIPS